MAGLRQISGHREWQFRCAALCQSLAVLVCIASRDAIAEDLTSEQAAKIKQLIELLASPNPAPQEIEKGRLTYPDGYDEKVEEGVSRAARELAEIGTSAFPLLMAHVEDRRFSYVSQSPNGAWHAFPVGKACQNIVRSQLDVYEQIGVAPAMLPSYFDSVVAGRKFETWWKAHHYRSLRDIQVESFEWAIKEQRKLMEDWKVSRDSRLKRKSEQLKDDVIPENESRLSELRRGEKPIKPRVPIRKHTP